MVGTNESEFACTEYNIVFPIYLCWGVYDTNEWSCVLDELNSLSNTSAMQVQNNGFYKNRDVKERQLRFLFERLENDVNDDKSADRKNMKKVKKKEVSISDLGIKF